MGFIPIYVEDLAISNKLKNKAKVIYLLVKRVKK
jgi:hypothetical protein